MVISIITIININTSPLVVITIIITTNITFISICTITIVLIIIITKIVTTTVLLMANRYKLDHHHRYLVMTITNHFQ